MHEYAEVILGTIRLYSEHYGLDPHHVVMTIGVLSGIGIGYLLGYWRARRRSRRAYSDAEQIIQGILPSLQTELGQLSATTLKTHVQDAVDGTRREGEVIQKGIEREFEAKTHLLDRVMTDVRSEISKVHDILTDVNTGQKTTVSELVGQIDRLNSVFSNEQARGRWQEDQTERLLKLLGFRENIDFTKQHATTDNEGTLSRPDITVKVSDARVINIDSKFPLNSYWAYCDASDDIARRQHKRNFLSAIRRHVRDVKNRPYFNPDTTVGYVLLYIHVDAVFDFLSKHGQDVIDEALDENVVICTTPTLYAILSLVHKFMETQRLETRTDLIISSLETFQDEWGKFTEKLDGLRNSAARNIRSIDELIGPRKRALEKPLNDILSMKQGELESD